MKFLLGNCFSIVSIKFYLGNYLSNVFDGEPYSRAE